MTRWLYLCNDLGIPLDGTKGASEHLRAITRALCRAGQDVSVLAPRGRLPTDHPAHQIHAAAGDEARRISEDLRAWIHAAEGPSGLASELGQIVYDARLGHALEQEGLVPPVDVVIERLSLACMAGRRFARRCGATYLLEMNAPLAQEAARYREAGLQDLGRQLEIRALREADVVLTVSEALRRHVIDYAALPEDRVVTVPNGVELELFETPLDRSAAREFARVPLDCVVFGFVGTLRPWHGVDVMFDAFRQLRREVNNVHLLIVGDERRVEHYRAQAAEMGIADAVTFHGEAQHHEVPRLLASMDVALAPYLPQETFYFSPLKLYEYMAAGLCVIASRAGQIAEILRAEQNGVLVTPGDAEALADAMRKVTRSPALRSRLGSEARATVAGRGWDNVAAQIIELAERLRRTAPAIAKEVAHVG